MDKKKWALTATIAIFVLMITALPLSWYLLPEEKRAENSENRELADFPTLEEPEDVETFSKGFDSWYSDHLPYKEQMVSLKSQAEIGILKELDSEQVILGTETPWLFYKADDGQAIETYKRTNQFSEESLKKTAEVLSGLKTELYEAGIDFVLAIAPDKETIYGPNYMPQNIRVMTDRVQRTDQLIAYLSEHDPDLKVLYPKEELLSQKEGLLEAAEKKSAEEGTAYTAWPLYYESDTHWNKIGAKVMADEIFDLLSETDRNWLTPYIDITFSNTGDGSSEEYAAGEIMKKEGDMQKLCKLPEAYDSMEFRAEGMMPADRIYKVTAPSGEEVYERYRSADGRAAKKKLYLAADSFRWNILDFVKGRAEESVVCSRYYLDMNDVTEQHPDVFVYMIAERYLEQLEVLPGVAAPALPYTEEFERADIY